MKTYKSLLEEINSIKEDSNYLGEEVSFEFLFEELDRIDEINRNITAMAGVSAVALAAQSALVIRGLYRAAHGVTLKQINACDGDSKCMKTAYIAGARKKISILQQAKAKNPTKSQEFDAKIQKLNDRIAKWSKSNADARAAIARSYNEDSNYLGEEVSFEFLFEDLDRIDEDFNINTTRNTRKTWNNYALAGASAYTLSVMAAPMIRALYRAAHGVTLNQINACHGDSKCIKNAYIAGARKKISILQQAKAKNPTKSQEFDAKIQKLNDRIAKWSKSNADARAAIARSYND